MDLIVIDESTMTVGYCGNWYVPGNTPIDQVFTLDFADKFIREIANGLSKTLYGDYIMSHFGGTRPLSWNDNDRHSFKIRVDRASPENKPMEVIMGIERFIDDHTIFLMISGGNIFRIYKDPNTNTLKRKNIYDS